MARRVGAVIGVIVLLGGGLAIVWSPGGGGGHTLRASFGNAIQVLPGQQVRVAGRRVGKVESVEEVSGQAVLELRIDDERVWPLPRGTTAGIRWGSNSNSSARYVELHPGPASAADLPDGGLLTQAETATPVEFDQIYRIFRGRTRGDAKVLIAELGELLGTRAPALRRALRDAPGGLDGAAGVLRELGADQQALRTLAVAGDRTASALAARERELRELVDHAAATFDELANHAGAQRASLDRLPTALDSSSATLQRLDVSLAGLHALVDDLAPGARALRRLAPPTRGALTELREVAPLAVEALRSGRRAAPSLTRLFAEGTPFLPRLGTVLRQLEPMVGCLRPYGPELAGIFSTWTDFSRNYDAQGHYVRGLPLANNALLAAGSPHTSEQVEELNEGRLFYAFPRPPGLNAGQPWFQPECGAGPESLDPSMDPEGAGR